MPSSFHSLEEMLDAQPSQLKALTERAKVLLRLQSALRSLLPEPIRDQCSVGQWEGSHLAVYASNGAVATRLKQQIPTFCRKLAQRGFDVQDMSVKVLMSHARPTTHAQKADIPQQALKQFSALSETLEAGPLKKAIDTLIKHRAPK